MILIIATAMIIWVIDLHKDYPDFIRGVSKAMWCV
jgi:hypothetical protein